MSGQAKSPNQTEDKRRRKEVGIPGLRLRIGRSRRGCSRLKEWRGKSDEVRWKEVTKSANSKQTAQWLAERWRVLAWPSRLVVGKGVCTAGLNEQRMDVCCQERNRQTEKRRKKSEPKIERRSNKQHNVVLLLSVQSRARGVVRRPLCPFVCRPVAPKMRG